MRSQRFLRDASVCQDADAIRDPEVKTYDQLRAHGHSNCPLFDRCKAGVLLGPNLRNCIPLMGQEVARYAAQSGGSVEAEMQDFRQSPVFSRLGFIDPYADPDPEPPLPTEMRFLRGLQSGHASFSTAESPAWTNKSVRRTVICTLNSHRVAVTAILQEPW